MNKLNDLTIALPIYSRPKNLIDHLESLKKINIYDFNIIIGDNGQNNFNINYFKENFPNLNIKYFQHEKNIGHISNFIFLLYKCKTKYFIWVADDDLYESNFFLRLYEVITKNKNTVSVMSNYKINRNGKITKIFLSSGFYLTDVFYILNPFPFIKNSKNYLKIFIYGIHNASILKKVINNEKWINERDIVSLLRSIGNFQIVDEFLFTKIINNSGKNQTLGDDYWYKFKDRGSFIWINSISKKINILELSIFKKITLYVFGLLIVIMYYLNSLRKFIIK